MKKIIVCLILFLLIVPGMAWGQYSNVPRGSGGSGSTLPADAPGYLKNDGSGGYSWDTPAGTGDVTKVGTPTEHQQAVWTGDGTIKGVTVTGSKVMCTNADGEPVACTNLTDLAFSGYVPTSWIVQAGANNVLTYTGNFSLGLTLTGNTSLTLPQSGTLMVNPMTTANDIIYGGVDGAATRMAIGGANTLLGVNAAGNGLEYKSTINVQLSDDAAQFKSATADKGTRKLVQSSISDGILLTDTPVITGDVTWTNISQGAGTYTRVFEEVLNVFTVKQEFDSTAGLQVGSTGVLITSDNDGAITFTGASAGNDEDLTFNFDDTADTVTVSSSTGVTQLAASGISLNASVPIYLSTDATVTVAGSAGLYFNNDDDVIAFNLPASPIDGAGNGKVFCFRNRFARAMTINPDDADYITKGATKAAQGEAIVSAGAADEMMCLVGVDADNWISMGQNGTWAEETP